jgi:alpha-beta hydrolase superfamily lysophospholipase
VKAIVQIVHGISEYVERYDALAQFLSDHGILVVAEDHMGHGKSIGGDGKPGYFAGGWFAATKDTYHLLAETMAEFPDVPYILLGHSMGSFLVRTILCQYPDSGISAAIISGTGWQSNLTVMFGKLISDLVCQLAGEQTPSRFLRSLCFGMYNARIKSPKTPYDWVLSDEALMASYIADPLCGGLVPSAGLMRDLMVGIRYIQQTSNLENMNKNLPVLFVSGQEDPVGDYGKGVTRTADAFKSVGMDNVMVKLYTGCRHEVHNEPNRQVLFDDLLQWLKDHVLNL